MRNAWIAIGYAIFHLKGTPMFGTHASTGETRTSAEGRASRDLLLIDSYRNGRANALDELLAAYAPRVRRILIKFGVRPCDLDDLAQEVFLRVFRNLSRFRGQSSFYSWLYRVAANVCFDDMKRRKRSDARLGRLRSAALDVTSFRGEDDDPYIASQNAALRDAMLTAIDALPKSFRTVVAMREVGDLTYLEIAEQTRLSIGTVRSRLYRARARLRILLSPHIEPVAA